MSVYICAYICQECPPKYKETTTLASQLMAFQVMDGCVQAFVYMQYVHGVTFV